MSSENYGRGRVDCDHGLRSHSTLWRIGIQDRFDYFRSHMHSERTQCGSSTTRARTDSGGTQKVEKNDYHLGPFCVVLWYYFQLLLNVSCIIPQSFVVIGW